MSTRSSSWKGGDSATASTSTRQSVSSISPVARRSFSVPSGRGLDGAGDAHHVLGRTSTEPRRPPGGFPSGRAGRGTPGARRARDAWRPIHTHSPARPRIAEFTEAQRWSRRLVASKFVGMVTSSSVVGEPSRRRPGREHAVGAARDRALRRSLIVTSPAAEFLGPDQ